MITPTPNFRALCAELIDELQYQTPYETIAELQDRARTALATPPPEPPTKEELQALWHELFSHDDTVSSGDVEVIACAALERWGHR